MELLYGREIRETLGLWVAGSRMPDRYDRAGRATELRLRAETTQKINSGWMPTKAYEVPPKQQIDEELQKKENETTDSETPPHTHPKHRRQRTSHI